MCGTYYADGVNIHTVNNLIDATGLFVVIYLISFDERSC